MEKFADEAIVLSCLDYGEADRLVTLLTRSHGRLVAFAAGARKSKRRFAGALEPGTWLSAQLVERRGDTLRLDSVEVRSSFHRIREALPLIARSLYCLELCRELTADRQPHEGLFDLLREYLELLEAGKAGPTSLIKFELDALDQAGFRPRFLGCALCGGESGERTRFDPEHGGVVCDACSARVPHGLPVAAEVVEAFCRLQRGERTPWSPALRSRGRQLLNAFIAHHLGRKLKSVDFMEQVGTD